MVRRFGCELPYGGRCSSGIRPLDSMRILDRRLMIASIVVVDRFRPVVLRGFSGGSCFVVRSRIGYSVLLPICCYCLPD